MPRGNGRIRRAGVRIATRTITLVLTVLSHAVISGRDDARLRIAVAIAVDATTHVWLLENPGANITIDIESTTITLPDGQQVAFSMDGFSRYCLLEGTDQLGFLQQQMDAIASFEEKRSWKP